MQTLTLQEIKSKGSKSFPKTGFSYVIVNSKPKVALVALDEFERMQEIIEEYEDVLAAKARENEEDLSEEEFIAKYGDELQINN